MQFDDEELVVGQDVVRSFVVTGGRTRTEATESLQLETLVEINPGAGFQRLQFERLDIARYVQSETTTSIAEIAAALRLPMLTTQVLVSDLVSEAILNAHQTANSEIDFSSLSDIRAAILSL